MNRSVNVVVCEHR